MPELPLCLRSSPALAGCITHPAPKVRSLLCVRIFTGMNRICWLRIAREFIDSYLPGSRVGLLFFFVDRAAFPHSTRPAFFTNLYNRCHRDSQLYYRRNKETGDDLAPDIRGCRKSSCEKRKNHQKTTIVREGFHRKTP